MYKKLRLWEKSCEVWGGIWLLREAYLLLEHIEAWPMQSHVNSLTRSKNPGCKKGCGQSNKAIHKKM